MVRPGSGRGEDTSGKGRLRSRETTPLRDRDGCYGEEFHEATGWLGFAKSSRPRDRLGKTYVERLIGTIRGECLDL